MKLGVIGTGNMGGAIIRGCISAGMDPEEIGGLGHGPEKTAAFAEDTGIVPMSSIAELTEKCDMVMAAVKPKDLAGVLAQVAPALSEDKILISIAAGKSIEDLEAGLREGGISAGTSIKIVRVMPNTPAMAGEGMSALCRSTAVTDEDMKAVMDIFAGIGRASEVGENMMDAVTGLSGSGPAYVYMFIEALADGAVVAGMPRAQAYEFAAQTVLGAAKMVLETGQHPGQLKDAVCSPAGTTIAAVRSLEAGGFRSNVMEAVMAAVDRSRSM